MRHGHERVDRIGRRTPGLASLVLQHHLLVLIEIQIAMLLKRNSKCTQIKLMSSMAMSLSLNVARTYPIIKAFLRTLAA